MRALPWELEMASHNLAIFGLSMIGSPEQISSLLLQGDTQRSEG
jgi:hypothetical protein